MALKTKDADIPAKFTDLDDPADVPSENLPAVPAAVGGAMALGVMEGDISPNDLRLPRLQIAYGVGGLSENFNPGDWVLGGDNLLAHKGEPLNLIILHARLYWKQYLSRDQYAAGVRPATYLTEAEVHANGGTTQWAAGSDGRDIGPSFGRALHMKMLIEQPENLVCGLFGVDLGNGKVYAPAVWDVDKSAYRRAGITVTTAADFSLRKRGLLAGVFQVKTITEKIGTNLTVVPVMKLVGFNTDAVVASIKSLFSGSSPVDAEPAVDAAAAP